MPLLLSSTTLVFARYPFEKVLEFCKRIGLDGLELYNPHSYKGIYAGTFSLDDGFIRKAKELIESHGLKTVSVNAGNNFVKTSSDEFKLQVKYVKECIDASVKFGCSLVRVFGGEPVKGLTEEHCIKLIVRGLRESVSYAEEMGVVLALENHGALTNNIDIELRILDDVNSKFLRLNVDTGNYYVYGYRLSEVNDILKRVASLAAHTHVKNAKTEKKEKRRGMGEAKPVPIPDGDLDIPWFISILKEAGYKGAISIEDEFEGFMTKPIEEVLQFLKRDVDYLKPHL